MNFSSQEIPPDPNAQPPRLHRRRQVYFPHLSDPQRVDTLENLARQVAPTFDFFTYSLLAGALLAAGLLLKSLPLLIAGAAVTPFMAPLLGMQLGLAAGSARLFFRSLGGLILGVCLVLICGIVAGLTGYPLEWNPIPLSAFDFKLPLDTILIMMVGVFTTTVLFLQEKSSARIASVASAFFIYSEISLCGIWLGRGSPVNGIQPINLAGLMILAAASLGCIPFIISGYRQARKIGYLIPLALLMLAVLMIWGQTSGTPFVTLPRSLYQTATVTPSPSIPPTIQASLTSTPSRVSPTSTRNPTSSATPTPDNRDILVVNVEGQTIARLRSEPGYSNPVLLMIPNGESVKYLGNNQVIDGVTWIEVSTKDGTIGWMVQTVFDTPTPAPLLTVTP